MSKSWQKVFIRRDSDVPTICGMILTAYKYLWHFKKDKKEYLFGFSKDGHYHYFSQDFDRYAFGRSLYKKYFYAPADIKKFYLKGRRFLKTTEKKTADWEQKLKKPAPTDVLLEAFLDFKKDFAFINDNYSIMPWWATEAWQNDFEKILSELIKRHKLAGQYDQIIQSATKSWKHTAIAQIKKDYSRGLSVPQLIKKYQFLRSWTAIWYKPIDTNWIKSALQKSVKLPNKFSSQKQLFQLLKPGVKEKQYFITAPYMVFFKDWRDDLRRKHTFLWKFLWEKIGKELGISAFDVGYFTLTEIEQMLLDGKINRQILFQRKNKPFLILIQGNKLDIKLLTGKFPKQFRQTILNDQKNLSEQSVAGLIGQPGIVTGKVVIVAGVKDLPKVKQGNILVANTTHPNYLLAMKKASAFITDEGGIASHAAIVARELQIPCIVGTKIATKVFKDGDIIEVDANTGMVKKIK